MKGILVPVDFSHNSSNALRYAGEIANVSKAEVFVLHVFQDKKLSKNAEVIVEDKLLKFTLHALRNHKKLQLSVKYSFHAVKNSNFIKGVLSSGLLDEIDLVVMGTKGASGLKGVFIGSNTFNLAQKIDKPLIAAPINTFFRGIKTILFCSDFNNIDTNTLKPLKEFAMLFNAEIRILHIRTHDKKPVNPAHFEESTMENKFFGDEVKHTFKVIDAGSVLRGINNYIDIKSDITMVALVNHKRSTLTSLFRTDHTRKLAFHSIMPVMILSENPVRD